MATPERPGQIIWTRDQVRPWFEGLSEARAERVQAAANRVLAGGPALGRPLVDRVHGSRHHNMKEMRIPGGHMRVLFAFDRQRRLVMLYGGDKTNNWRGWYKRAIRHADRIYDRHIRGMGDDPPWGMSTGRRAPSPRVR